MALIRTSSRPRGASSTVAYASTSGGPFESGKPWPRLIAPVSRARIDMRSKKETDMLA